MFIPRIYKWIVIHNESLEENIMQVWLQEEGRFMILQYWDLVDDYMEEYTEEDLLDLVRVSS